MSRGKDLPIMIGHSLQKGMFIARNGRMGGYDMLIVWLKRPYKSGEEFFYEDMDKIDGVLHFCDRESIESMRKGLDWMLNQWKEEEE